MNVLVALSNRLLTQALTELISGSGGGRDVRADGEEASESFSPDIVILDFGRLRDPQRTDMCFGKPSCLLLDSGLTEDEIVVAFVRYKVSGIISRGTDMALLNKAFRAIAAGEIWIDNKTVKSLLASGHSIFSDKGKVMDVTPREEEILSLLSKGYRNKDIAKDILVSEQTVKAHLNKLFKKFNVSNRTQLLSIVSRNGIREALSKEA